MSTTLRNHIIFCLAVTSMREVTEQCKLKSKVRRRKEMSVNTDL